MKLFNFTTKALDLLNFRFFNLYFLHVSLVANRSSALDLTKSEMLCSSSSLLKMINRHISMAFCDQVNQKTFSFLLFKMTATFA